jgi:phage tail protein X
MNSYEFAYYGRRLAVLNETIASWCAHRDCVLETTALLQGARLRISGPDATVREAIRTVRLWIRSTN